MEFLQKMSLHSVIDPYIVLEKFKLRCGISFIRLKKVLTVLSYVPDYPPLNIISLKLIFLQ